MCKARRTVLVDSVLVCTRIWHLRELRDALRLRCRTLRGRIRRNTSPRRKFARCQLQALTATPVNQLTRSKTGVRVYWDTFPESEYGLSVLRNRLAFARNVNFFLRFFSQQ